MSRVPQIWTNTDKEGKGTTLLPIVNADGKLMVDVDMATEGIATESTLADIKTHQTDGTQSTQIVDTELNNVDFATEATLAKLTGLTVGEWDKVTQTQTATEDIWAFELASVATKTVTVTYTDETKGTISTVVLS